MIRSSSACRALLRPSLFRLAFGARLAGAALVGTTLAAVTWSATASAQGNVSAADKKAARELFNAGLELQNAGKFADALDKFSRAQAVINAPTNLLHMAECQAAMGQLVEATESYRQLSLFPLDANSPEAFRQAKDQGAKESQQIDATRIPELKIDVQPKDVPTLTVTIDDKPINSALVGVSRPVNPGSHKVAATAPGYSKAEQTVELKEREHKAITLTITNTGGVTYGDAGATGAGAGGTTATSGNGTTPPPGSDKSTTTTPPMKAQDPGSKLGLWVGARLGLYLPAGSLPGFSSGPLGLGSASLDGVKMSDVAGPGGDIGLEGAFRFAKVFYVGAYLEGAALSGKKFNGSFNGSSYTDADTKTATALFMASLGYISSAEATVAFLMDLGLGYRALSLKIQDDSYNYGGLEIHLGAGVPVKAGEHVRIIPKIEWNYGLFSSDTGQLKGSGTTAFNSTIDGHSFFFIGVGGYFNMDLDKKSGPKK